MTTNSTTAEFEFEDLREMLPPIFDAKRLEDSTLPHPAAQPHEAAFPRRRMEYHRQNGSGPPFIKEGRRVLYRRDDFIAWIASQRRTTLPPRTSTPQSEDGQPVV